MWNRLLRTTRLRRSTSPSHGDLRTPFESDRDRIIFSPAFRRMQDKTQVFPLEAHDFIRTRLTHTLEVAALGRSLGSEIGIWLHERGEVSASQAQRDIPTVVETACLAHDLGNPPFGHSGEEAIRSWFRDHLHEHPFSALEAQEQCDLLHFEGNAQGFRILTRLQRLHDDRGLNLTVASLAAFAKYPIPSNHPDSPWGQKFGFFLSERETAAALAEQLDLASRRHPLVFLVEAADDIAYRIIDVEDAVRKHLLDVCTVAERLEQHRGRDEDFDRSLAAASERFTAKRDDPDARRAFMHDLRLSCTTRLFRGAVEAFQRRYEEILDGRFQRSILADSDAGDLAADLFAIGMAYAYTHESVMRLELQGRATLHRLLDRIVPACLAPESRRRDRQTMEGKIYALLSKNQRYLYETSPTPGSPPYRAIQLACDYVSGMTDSFALAMSAI